MVGRHRFEHHARLDFVAAHHRLLATFGAQQGHRRTPFRRGKHAAQLEAERGGDLARHAG